MWDARIWISSTRAGSRPSRAAASKPMRARNAGRADRPKSSRVRAASAEAIAEGRAVAAAVDRYLTGASRLPAPISPYDRPLHV